MDAHLNPYWIMRKFLAKTMMEWEIFGDLAYQVLSNTREDMQRDMEVLECFMDLKKYPFVRGLVNGTSPSVIPEQTLPYHDEDPPTEDKPSPAGVW